ncbi:NAD(P)/FAD-dependent oxidoreductase [Roseobacter sp. HKCCA0434]|uniref:NAD(P)/FAD-dependent oxidoreductase n=1 Tax=Roseobacter sp. HKCCA0434 TaxID=3079297 RepID=UPI002905F202|nr:NAD(P)-binding protein [Roseobacter sp. HKCCA0434]
MNVAIVGAGLAGLSCARVLHDDGLAVQVFDKGRAPGGRVSTRTSEAGTFDHGAAMLHGLPADFISIHAATLSSGAEAVNPAPVANALPRSMAEGLDVTQSAKITGITREDACWSLSFEDGSTRHADRLGICIPPAQAKALLPEDVAFEIAAEMRPQWTLMAACRTGTDRDVIQLGDGHVARRQGGSDPERWVVQADAAWSADNVDTARDVVRDLLWQAFRTVTDAGGAHYLAIHRWLYARTRTPLDAPCLWDPEAAIGVAGDWCLGDTAGDAVLSGRALAKEMLT